MQGNPFARATMMMAAIAAAMSLSGSAQREAMAGIGPYVSRGKGRGKSAKWLGGSARSKYMPHIGAKEQERAKRCYMVSAFIGGPERSAPVMHQTGKPSKKVHVYATEQEYESVF
ncbi:hypothetical protein [Paraburkholderia graminis]|uniref:hypothetical protein n=1 Tax=Paraburkholderia graminis TaxID=60548 RepID=UPI0038B91A77